MTENINPVELYDFEQEPAEKARSEVVDLYFERMVGDDSPDTEQIAGAIGRYKDYWVGLNRGLSREEVIEAWREEGRRIDAEARDRLAAEAAQIEAKYELSDDEAELPPKPINWQSNFSADTKDAQAVVSQPDLRRYEPSERPIREAKAAEKAKAERAFLKQENILELREEIERRLRNYNSALYEPTAREKLYPQIKAEVVKGYLKHFRGKLTPQLGKELRKRLDLKPAELEKLYEPEIAVAPEADQVKAAGHDKPATPDKPVDVAKKSEHEPRPLRIEVKPASGRTWRWSIWRKKRPKQGARNN